MPRVKSAPASRRRHKRILKLTKGQRGARHRLYRTALEAARRGLADSTRDRKVRKRDFRRLWIVRIGAEARAAGLSYRELIHGAKTARIELDRKILADLAVRDREVFHQIAELAKRA